QSNDSNGIVENMKMEYANRDCSSRNVSVVTASWETPNQDHACDTMSDFRSP
ncbi:unnamed protein product, partial [Musa acuminata subsp. burmannicoides]